MWSMILLGLVIWGGIGLLWILAFNILGLGYNAYDAEADKVTGRSQL